MGHWKGEVIDHLEKVKAIVRSAGVEFPRAQTMLIVYLFSSRPGQSLGPIHNGGFIRLFLVSRHGHFSRRHSLKQINQAIQWQDQSKLNTQHKQSTDIVIPH